jgi:hypothetical protein
MKKRLIITAASLFVLIPLGSTSSSANSFNWTVGQEREVDEGFYYKLLKVENGWRLWRLETRSGVTCLAVKPAIGLAAPVPLGVAGLFRGGEPRLILRWSDYQSQFVFDWEGKDYSNDEVQIRVPGSKFWSDARSNAVYSDKQRLEVSISSWEYPAIHVGYHEAKGVFDLTGLDAMREQIARCQPPVLRQEEAQDPLLSELDLKYPDRDHLPHD